MDQTPFIFQGCDALDPGGPEHLHRLRRHASEDHLAAQLDPNLEELNDIKTAVSEAVTNCIVHAYRDTIGLVTIRCRILPDSVLDVVVRDKGCGMEDIEKARTPMFTTGGPERSGMGFTIMESFMTSLQVTSKPGRGTTVHMKRKIVQRGKNA